jgi:hypothetical protein
MDPLSITLAITSLIKTSRTLATYSKRFIQAPDHITKLLRKVQQLKHELKIMKRQVNHPQLSQYLPEEHISELLEATQGSFQELDSILRNFLGEDGKELRLNRFNWLRSESKCQELLSCISENLEKVTRLKDSASVLVALLDLQAACHTN